MRVFLLFIMTLNFLFSAELFHTIKTNSNVTNIGIYDDLLYISTDGGEVQITNLQNFETEKFINIPETKNFFGIQKAKIFNIDKFDDEILILATGNLGKKVLYLYKNNFLKSIELKNESIKKAKFITKNKVVLASLSNEIYFYDLDEEKLISSYKFSTSALSDFEILDDEIIVSCEGGSIFVYSIKQSAIIQTINAHKDNIYDIEVAKNKTIISGSTDRKVGIYKDKNLNFLESKFLVYAVGISNDGKTAAFMSDEDSKITVFDTKTLNKLDDIKTDQGIINGIIFYKNLIITSSYAKDIKVWRLK